MIEGRPSRLRVLAGIAGIGALLVTALLVTGAARSGTPPSTAGADASTAATASVVPVSTSAEPAESASASGSAAPTVAASVIPGDTPAIASAADTPSPSPRPPRTPAPTPLPRTPAPPATPAPPSGWVNVVNDKFDSGGLPSHWVSYDGPYGSGARNCAIPSHAVVSGGFLHLVMSYEASGSPCGAGWYTAGLVLTGHSSVDQRVTVRFRVVDSGVAGHFIVPMRWPDDGLVWPAAGEEDFCESDTASGCTTFLHYSSANRQNLQSYSVDLTQWHTLRFQRLNHVVSAFIDNMGTPVWTFAGNSNNLPDTLKHVVLQQECHTSCPAGTTGSEDIQIDWITVDNPG